MTEKPRSTLGHRLREVIRFVVPWRMRRRLRHFMNSAMDTVTQEETVPPAYHRETAWRLGLRGNYEWHKAIFMKAALRDDALLAAFQSKGDLPPEYGIGVDERCIEYPWVLARLSPRSTRVLDAGSTLNHDLILQQPQVARKQLTILTLGPERVAFWQRGISYVYGDLRDINMRDSWFDEVACISTLEHVGFDNSGFTGQSAHHEQRPDEFPQVMRELARVLRPGGTLLLTVPYGPARLHRNTRIFDAATLNRAVEAFGPATRTDEYYRYDERGWAPASAARCADREYVPWTTQPPADWPNPIPIEPDFAICARAVACITLVKAS